MSNLSFFYFITLLLFNYIHSVQCQTLYFAGDLSNITLDGNTVIDSSKWIQVANYESFSLAYWPFLGGISSDKLFFATSSSYGTSAVVSIVAYDTTLNKWVTNSSITGNPGQTFLNFEAWITDRSTGKAYSLQYISNIIEIFDTVNYAWANSSVIPQTYQTYVSTYLSTLYGPPQVLLPSGIILYFASESSSSIISSTTTSMGNILSYNIKANSWQFINTTGQIPSLRTDYTAVSVSDGRVIIYGGTSNTLAASPSIVVLNTSNYVWSAPSEVNPIGPLTQHTSVIVNNFMIAAFGINATDKNILTQNNKNIYKLDVSDPLTYKWSVLSIYKDLTTSKNKTKVEDYIPTAGSNREMDYCEMNYIPTAGSNREMDYIPTPGSNREMGYIPTPGSKGVI
ncbi:26754_t:CDS:2 [Dentiscutata erythropus]|uniref:26754_t:CDS:1 n=1 Tax=Dentiscutata erythropus TaxID=1348616 RepID=A0A9N9BBX3_9GLOM|nr:26754_t:CDS:2 [Dentiscutata erythropus]